MNVRVDRARSRGLVEVFVVVMLLPLLVLIMDQPAHGAVPRPAGLKSQASVTAVTVSWRPVPRATEYHVQMATSSSFADPILDENTDITVATPTEVVPFGKLYWRVAATRGNGWSSWTSSSFSRSQRSGPILAEPDDGAVLNQPEHPPVLRWDPVPGAQSYVVEIDGEERDWVDTETYETETTSVVPTETQMPGTYWWRVRAFLDDDVNTRPSADRSYTIGPLPSVSLKETASTMQDVVLQWDPVPGAVDYEVRVSTDNDFNVITDQKFVSGTRYSPPTTYDNASYWWQVRARDVFGQTEEWSGVPTGQFQRTWPDKPALVYPTQGATVTGDLYFQWTPVQHASSYLLDVGPDPGFSDSRKYGTCETTQSTYTPGWWIPRSTHDKCVPDAGGQYYWRVRALDYNGHPVQAVVDGRFSEVGSFTWTPTAVASGALGATTGQRVMLDGSGTGSCATSFVSGGVCEGISQTPVLDWDPAPGAASYIVYLAHDLNFTNMVKGYGNIGDPNTMFHTTNTRFAPPGDPLAGPAGQPGDALPDTQAGEAYYWFIRPCDASGLCGLTPEEATNAFRKKSPPVRLLSPATDAQVEDQVTFDWTDYLAANDAPGAAIPSDQAAQSYRIQVAQNPSFTKTKDDEVYEDVVDQTTFTAFADSYPEGVLYWRVQAIDGSGNGLTWSQTRQFTKASPAPLATSPTDGQVVNGVQPFRWEPRPYSKYYDLEVYRNSDTTASSANRALTATNIRQTAYTAEKPLQALGQDFVWRLRRTDHDGHKGAWGPWHRFRVTAGAPRILQPGSRVRAARTLFSWRASPQAASYRWELRRRNTLVQSAETAGTAYAPTDRLDRGTYTWRVVSYDSERNALRATPWRKVKVW